MPQMLPFQERTTGLHRPTDIAKNSSDAVLMAATGITSVRGPALMAILVRRYTAPMAHMVASVIGVVIPTTAGATTAKLCPADWSVTSLK